MRWLLAVAAVGAAGLLAGCPEGDLPKPLATKDGSAAPPAPTASALLEEVKGAVTLERKGKQGPAQLGYLYVGDALQTGEDGSAVVRFGGGRVVELGPDGRFELTEGESGLALSVGKGLVLTRLVESAPSQPLNENKVELTLLTPFGFTRVSANDDVKLAVDDQRAQIDVKLGAVDLVTKDGKVQQLGAGQNGQLGALAPLVVEPLAITLTTVGRAELKRKEENRWNPAGKKLELSAGDSFRVKDGRVVMQATGGQSTLGFAKGSEVTVASAGKSPTGEEAGFDLKRGELQAQLPVPTRVSLAGGVSLVAEGGSAYTVRRTRNGYELLSTTGDVRIERPKGEPATVFGGRVASIPLEGAVKSEALPREALLLPSRSGLRVLQSSVNRVALTWDGETDEAFKVDVATDPAYKQRLLSGVLHQRFVNVTPPARGTLYWRVADASDKEVAKGSASFAPEPSSADLDRNDNEVEDGRELTVIHYQDKLPKVIFTWQPAPEAKKYKLQVFRKADLSRPIIEKVASAERLEVPEGLGEGDYLWGLKYLDDRGTEVGGTAKLNKLLITYDNAVPNLIIRTPRNGDPGGAKVRCSGVAPVGAKVFVNGRAVSLDEKSRFDTEVAPIGPGLLAFRMLNGASEVYTVRKVRRGK